MKLLFDMPLFVFGFALPEKIIAPSGVDPFGAPELKKSSGNEEVILRPLSDLSEIELFPPSKVKYN